jgi:hypothetical protein
MADQDASPAAERAARLLGARLAGWEHLTGAGGYTPAFRLRVELDDGRTAFVKAASNDPTAGWLRDEARVYDTLDGCGFLPRRLGCEDDGARPVLVLEDLSGAAGHWPPPWRPGDVERVLETLAAVRPCAGRFAPGALPRLADLRADFAGWATVAADPAPFLSLGMCSAAWLDVCIPGLLAAADAAPLDGGDLCHLDTRSDNVCLAADGRTVLVDWNWAVVGNGVIDIAGWLPSLRREGGPEPEEALRRAGLPDQPEFAALLAGFWAARAGLPSPPDAPKVRAVQKAQLTVALPWAARALGLPPPDGPVFKTGG